MPETTQDKTYYDFSRGLITERSEVNFPVGASISETDFELLVDGSRRRRKGIAIEGSTAGKTLEAVPLQTTASSTYKWLAAGSDPDVDFIVSQIGARIYFSRDAIEVGALGETTKFIDLSSQLAPSPATIALLASLPLSYASGRGDLIIANRYMEPSVVEYDGTDFTLRTLVLQVRDFFGINDGVAMDEQPDGGVAITDTHKYNLVNRGWSDANIVTYEAGNGDWPSKAMIWWKGLIGTGDTTRTTSKVKDEDFTLAFDQAKLDGEGWQDSTAPTGALLEIPYASTSVRGTGTGVINTAVAVATASSWAGAASPAHSLETVQIDVTVAGTPFSPMTGGDAVRIDRMQLSYNKRERNAGGATISKHVLNLTGEYAVLASPAPTTSTFSFTTTEKLWNNRSVPSFQLVINQLGIGTLKTYGNTVENVTVKAGQATANRPTCTEWYAGRAFCAGVAHKSWADVVFFSQISLHDDVYERCFQRFAPTDRFFNQLQDDDGGTIQVPGLANVVELRQFRGSLLLFAREGIWEIRGGQGFFSANDIAIRKLSSVECLSPRGVTVTEFGAVATAREGLILISPNPRTGLLEANNIIETTIQTKWNEIPSRKQYEASMDYDHVLKRLYLLYSNRSASFGWGVEDILIFDFRLKAWFAYTVGPGNSTQGISAVVISGFNENTTMSSHVKLLTVDWTSVFPGIFYFSDANNTSFVDFDGTQKIPTLKAGWDSSTAFTKRSSAPVLWTYMQRTETGFTEGPPLEAINESSLTVIPRWEWTDNNTPNKSGKSQECYKRRRDYIPADGSLDFDDGYPVVASRIKLRGSGKALSLEWTGATDKDAHLLGWALRYKANNRNM